jgi:glycyl-tRNA synthetase beta chain
MAKQPAKEPASATLLVELLTEELPPKALQSLSDAFAESLAEALRKDDFLEPDSKVHPYATPRRLALRITRVRERAPDKAVESSGPSIKIGLDEKGQPTQALLSFAKKYGVEVSALVRRQTPKGEFFFRSAIAKGGHLEATLAIKVAAALEDLPIPKVMRWGSGEAQFARPVHGLVMLHGAHEISGNMLGAENSTRTRGHRFLSTAAIVLKHADDYERTLREQGKVIVDFAARRTLVVKALEEAAGRGAALVADDALLDEITALVEWPAVYAGEFGREFLEVPEECLVLSMQRHQKYVPLRDKGTGKLLPRFLFVSNVEAKQPREIIHGNERVLRARLADARFFYDQDRKTRLEARVPRLAGVVYHGKLGSQLERVERIQLLAGKIAHGIDADPLLTGRAAWLSKADTLTEMVGEFPELQGTMGRYYALNDGEPKPAAEAIEAHCRPRFAGDALPDSPIGLAVALADRLDALAGLFGIGQAPTGDRDPFGLRRAALGIVRILVERHLALSLHDLIAAAIKEYGGRVGDAQEALESFVYERLAGYLRDAGYTTLEVDSVVSLRPGRIDLTPRQLAAVRAFNKLPEAESLAAANKRVANILRQAAGKGESFAAAEEDKLKEPAERELYSALAITADNARGLYERGDFTGFLKTFAALKGPVDAFFDSVMVMVDDRELRQNRLALLAELRNEMNRVADLSKLAA